MATVTQEYLEKLPGIYRDILAAFPAVEPSRKVGYGLAMQTLYENLRERQWSLGQVIAACQEMEKGGAVEIKNGIFVHPTRLGEDIISHLTGEPIPDQEIVPPFPSPPA